MSFRLGFFLLLLTFTFDGFGADRINQEGRILGPQIEVKAPILFNTPEADSVLSSLQIMPVTNPWNEDISKRPLLVNSDAMIAQIISDLATNRRALRIFFEMNFALVPDNQPLAPIRFFNYPTESDPSPYPIPSILPIETWPKETGSLSLRDWQMDTNNVGGDRHSIMVQPGTGGIWETWLTKLKADGSWDASNGAKFNMNSNAQRPSGWTSGDAAGLPMFPALIRFDECERGMVEHAMRVVVKRSRREYIYPATHFASTTAATETNVPAMGQRVRLKSSFAIPAGWTKHEQAVLKGLKKYGAMVADNGGFFSISATPDSRWAADEFSHLSSINVTNFEVIQTTGPNEGPRSPGAPRADAGPDQLAPVNAAITLNGAVDSTGGVAVQWSVYSGPGTVGFGDATKTNTAATFIANGNYVLMLSAADGVHAPAFDAVNVTVTDEFRMDVSWAGNSIALSWSGIGSPFVVEQASLLAPLNWTPVLTTTVHIASIPITNARAFLRLRQP